MTFLDRRELIGSDAYAVNNSGQVVGVAAFPQARGSGAFLWQDGQMTFLGNAFAADWTSVALSINEDGLVVGVAYAPLTASHAVLWQDGKMTDLGTMGQFFSEARSINDNGEVIGIAGPHDNGEVTGIAGSQFQLPSFPWIWRRGKATKLVHLIPPKSGWDLVYVTGINNRGQIIGGGYP